MADKDDRTRTMPALDPEALARAERAVAALGDSFVEQLKNDIVTIRTLTQTLALSPEPPNKASIEPIYTFAHDIRGQGGSFGYPLLTEIGGSLSDFIERRGSEINQNDITVLQAHLDAAAGIVSCTMTGDGDATSRALLDTLETLVQKRLTSQC